MEELQAKLDKINNSLSQLPVVGQLVKASGIKPFYMILLFLLVSACFVAFELPGSMILIQIIGVAYPCWCSILALETIEDYDDDKKWLTYWMVFNLFNMLDQSFKWITSYIPFFLLIRLFILIWLQSPTSEGAAHIYKRFVKPFAQKYGEILTELDNEFIKPYEPQDESVSDKKVEKEVKKTVINDYQPKKPETSSDQVSPNDIKLEEKEDKKDQ